MKKIDKNNQKSTRTEELKQLTEQLEESVKKFMDSTKYQNFLIKMSRFHSYSLNNQLLIALQKPDATLCASYTNWNKLNRNVKKGEHGIKIICPAPYKVTKSQDKIDPQSGKPELLPDGSIKQEKVVKIIPSYKVGYTFDVSQTEGEPLPEIAHKLEGSLDDGLKELKDALIQTSPAPVSFQPIEGGANGFYRSDTNEIVVDSRLSEQQSLKTLIHEIAHSILHNPTATNTVTAGINTKEVQAESTAFIVSKFYGLDTSEYSFGYISSWSSGKDVKELKDSLETIRTTANDIIDKAERKLKEIQASKQTIQTVEEITQSIHKGRCL